VVAVLQVDRLEDEDVGRVLDLAVAVPRREFDVGDEGISRIRGVELAEGGAAELLVLADRSEREAAERGRLRPGGIDDGPLPGSAGYA